jgi:uncharacterized protein YbjQ (UPF0145 family)
MPIFGGRGDGGDAERAEASVRALEAGGIPVAAAERLDELRRRGGRFFTSDLSTAEFLLIREAGFRPLTQVMGSCFYQVGMQWMPGGQASIFGGGWPGYGDGQTIELETQSEAWNEARRLAVGRLAEEARRAGADAVVGVRVQRGVYDWAGGLIEFVAVGTAVVSERYDLGEGPLLSNLSGQEFATLLRSGYWPAGLVAGSTVCYVVTGWRQQQRSTGLFSSWQNQELPDYTQGFYDARHQALRRVERQAHGLGAHGVVGLRLEHEQHHYERNENTRDLIVTVHALGTAIVEATAEGRAASVFTALRLE